MRVTYYAILGAAFTGIFYGKLAARVNSNLNWENKELLKYAVSTGRSMRVLLSQPSQTVLTQHLVSVELDCSDLLEHGVTSVFWSKMNIDNSGKISM